MIKLILWNEWVDRLKNVEKGSVLAIDSAFKVSRDKKGELQIELGKFAKVSVDGQEALQ